ncbi:MAG: DUF1311 domain-containing protein [Lachnospiraceae bacterium]|nr:DUF1311 domain-containing protein [Lachnospiraceae bacterium]
MKKKFVKKTYGILCIAVSIFALSGCQNTKSEDNTQQNIVTESDEISKEEVKNEEVQKEEIKNEEPVKEEAQKEAIQEEDSSKKLLIQPEDNSNQQETEAVDTEETTERVYMNIPKEPTEITSDIDAELAAIEAEAEILNTSLQSGELSQIELNATSAELYKLWDDELNSIWSRLKEKLDAETMATLTEEEIAWINEKETTIAEIGEEYGAGTIRPLIENDKAAEMTRERVYELAELLR